MYYSSGTGGGLHIYSSNEYTTYTIETGSILPVTTPPDNAIENNYFNMTGPNPGVYKYDGTVWELTDIGNSPGEEDFAYTDNDGQLVETISAS